MKKILFKAITVLLSVMLLSGVLAMPVSVSAEEGNKDPVLASGDCGANGDNAQWFFFDDLSIAIFGIDEIADFTPADNGAYTSPWYSPAYKTFVFNMCQKIAIEGGITAVGNYSFYIADNDSEKRANSLRNIDLPYTLRSIGRYAFYNQAGIQDIVIPAGVTHIGANAFGGCTGLQTIKYYGDPEKLTWDNDGQVEFPTRRTVQILSKYAGKLSTAPYRSLENEKNIRFEAVLELDGGSIDDNIERNIKGYIGTSNTRVFGGAAPFIVVGKFDGNNKSVTYSSNGFVSCVKIGSEYYILTDNVTGNLYKATTDGNGRVTSVATTPHPGLKLKLTYEYVGVNTVKLKYTLTNNGNAVSGISLGGGGDIKIGADDTASIKPLNEGDNQVGFYMRSTQNFDKASQSDNYATLGFIGKGVKKSNSSSETYPDADFFFGAVSINASLSAAGVYRHYFMPQRIFDKLSGQSHSDEFTGNKDSGMSYHWDNIDLAANQSAEYAVLFSVYGTNETTGGNTIQEEMTAKNFTVTWKNDNGSEIVKQYVKEGDVPIYPGLTPEKAETAESVYTFKGWTDGTTRYDKDDTLPAVTEDITYTAEFNEKQRLFTGHSITLNGSVNVNFFLNPNIIHIGDSVRFTWFDKRYECKITEDTPQYRPAGASVDYYKVTCKVAAAEMAYNIHAAATINNAEYTDETDDYSVREYGEVILNSPAGTFEKQDALDKLIEEMLNYGAKAQVFFDRIPENPANINVKNYSMAPVTSDMITARKSDMRANLDGVKLQYLGTTLVYLSETTLRHYYKALDGANITALKNAAAAGGFDYGEKDGLIYFEKKDIAAAELDSVFTLSFGGNNNYSFSALDFSKLVLDSSKPDADKKLAAATYWYNDAANTYFG